MRAAFTLMLVVLVPCFVHGHGSSDASSHDTGDSPIDTLFLLEWWSVDGGGGASAGGDLALVGVAGQPESGISSAGRLALEAGLWSQPVDLGFIFADDFESGDVSCWRVAAHDVGGVSGVP